MNVFFSPKDQIVFDGRGQDEEDVLGRLSGHSA